MEASGRAAVLDRFSEFTHLLGAPTENVNALLDAIADGVMVFDTGRRLLFANACARELLAKAGVEPSSVGKRQAFYKLFQPDAVTQLDRNQSPLQRALRGESVNSFEFFARTSNASVAGWFESSARPLRNSEGDICGAVCTIREITSQKKHEIALKTNAQFHRVLYQDNMAGILHTHVDGRILDCNDALVRMFGYSSRQEILALRAQQLFFDPEDRDRLLRLLSVPRRLSEFEVCYRRRDGSRLWTLLNARILDPAPDQVGGTIVSTVIDITERKIWEESLRQSEQRFSAFMRHMPGVAFIKNIEGRYLYYNDVSVKLFDIHPEQIVGKTDEEIWPADIAEKFRMNDAKVVETRQPVEAVELVPQSGDVHSWLMYKFPIIENGEVVLVGGIGIDVTERMILEEQLTQARKMEALGRLGGGVAHDFNNLLTVISGYGQLALEGIGHTPQDRLTYYIQEILNSSRRATALTTQLLAFSRRQVIQTKVLDLGDLLCNMERLLQRMIGEHIDLTVKCGSAPCLIRADAHQIEQVVMNLAVNARDAMPLGGTLEIECRLIEQPIERSQAEPLRVMLQVRDTGIGMDEEIKSHIFEPFFTSKETGKGTGLGLSTVYGIVSQSGGEIQFESQPGEGSCFRVYFPSTEAEAVAETSAPANTTARTGKETILLVEDEPSVRSLAEEILKRLGYRVFAADCGRSALDLWHARPGNIDVLLTDVIMPHMSGGELANKLRHENPRLKVLFMSGYTDEVIANHGVLAGETQLIQKPFTAEALGRKLRDLLDA